MVNLSRINLFSVNSSSVVIDVERLLDQAKGKSSESKKTDGSFGLGGFAPALFALALMGLTGLALWLLAKNARRSEALSFSGSAPKVLSNAKEHQPTHGAMPDRAKALFAGIDLDLTPVKKPVQSPAPDINPLADALRVKLNLARAYITIEDFSAAKKSLQEIVHIGSSIDPAITIEAQGLLAELSHRNS
jgi:pilus assembly protein FimV